jgi:polyphosphate kinase 2 (PPK2 family)
MRSAHLQSVADRSAERRGEGAPLSVALLATSAGKGEAAIFDRSWYGRVLVERVEGFAAPAEWGRAYDEINEFEAQLAADGATIVKLFFHITQETQDAAWSLASTIPGNDGR